MKNNENINNMNTLLTYLRMICNINVDISNDLWSNIRNKLINNDNLDVSEIVIINFLNDIDINIRNLIQKIYNIKTYKTDIKNDPPEHIKDRIFTYQHILSKQIKREFG